MEPEQPQIRYFVYLDWYEENQRSFFAMAQSRMCLSCCKKVGGEEELSVSTFDEAKGTVIFKTVKQRYGDDPMATIVDCCSHKTEFITPVLPLAETIFRLFLAGGNQPMTVEAVCQWLHESLPGDTRDISVPAINRLLAKDQAYGFRAASGVAVLEG